MADNGSNGPSTATIALVGLLATPIVLFLVFWLVGGTGSGAPRDLPEVQGKGLQWAENEVRQAGFNHVEAYDSLGRDRHWRDDRDWKVCFRQPAPSSRPRHTTVSLGVVQTREQCPQTDQGVYRRAVATMPDLTNRTAFITSKIFGPDASVRYVDRQNGSEVTRGLGDWRVCSQLPRPGERFDGVPVTTLVVKYEQTC